MLVQQLYQIKNFPKILTEINDIIQTAGFVNNQIICQTLEEGQEDWHTGIGRIEELEIQSEKKYCNINPKLKGSELEEIILRHNAYRTRIMSMPARQCYSIHADPSKRIHIPLITNSQAWMIWPTLSECHHMPRGTVYLTDTTKPHTFINAHTENRIHIIMCVDN